jgi:hypothetical protein
MLSSFIDNLVTEYIAPTIITSMVRKVPAQPSLTPEPMQTKPAKVFMNFANYPVELEIKPSEEESQLADIIGKNVIVTFNNVAQFFMS